MISVLTGYNIFNLSNVVIVALYLPIASCSFAYFKLITISDGFSKISWNVISATEGLIKKIDKIINKTIFLNIKLMNQWVYLQVPLVRLVLVWTWIVKGSAPTLDVHIVPSESFWDASIETATVVAKFNLKPIVFSEITTGFAYLKNAPILLASLRAVAI